MSHDSEGPHAELDVSGKTDVAQFLDGATDDLREVLDEPGGPEYLEAMLIYVLRVSYTPDERLRQIMAKVGPDAVAVYARCINLLRAEGEARGRVQTLVQLLTLKFGMPPVTAVLKMDAASVEQLETWTARVFSATTLDEVLA
jgi:hypothetical protein